MAGERRATASAAVAAPTAGLHASPYSSSGSSLPSRWRFPRARVRLAKSAAAGPLHARGPILALPCLFSCGFSAQPSALPPFLGAAGFRHPLPGRHLGPLISSAGSDWFLAPLLSSLAPAFAGPPSAIRPQCPPPSAPRDLHWQTGPLPCTSAPPGCTPA